MLFQEAIAIKFGFLACSFDDNYQYIHLTGITLVTNLPANHYYQLNSVGIILNHAKTTEIDYV